MIDLRALREKPTLVGERVRLVPLSAEHADDFYESTRDEEIRRLTGAHRRPGYDEIRQWCATRAEQIDRLDLAIFEEPGGRFVGELALDEVDPDNESAAYRIALSAIEFTGQGLGKEATRLILDYAFNRVRLHRVWLNVYAFNMRAIAVYRACGFTVEGRLRDALLWDGRRHDALVMGLLESDFRRSEV
ncbi:GNAT family N-acetyltransferase [Streptomonospora nanhaiensis]|uniref:RimJ/RimL family protein N-acetyltransferase n=1 Tax=Streptomonospora nanhaiensis TaxID=1323731 RepID=A0A853BF50_9ACTN|nr:GNAT family protein [Streptomonospora nanhaiensis]MBV2366124.1 GNAT family N-acetyltransferase [Streptomonospora nanhaiensis]MBX9391215.1 GNAT family N-acetyltransferase [Streptomonospora nanhaiensis]NYI93899.1 RimJ/RimL family protein N-acetyltransferase [Streptomonospora nanhaiensis]